MSASRENLERNTYVCYEDNKLECTNLEHARGYLFAFGRGPEADWETFRSAPNETILKTIEELGFTKCELSSKCSCCEGDCFKRLQREKLT